MSKIIVYSSFLLSFLLSLPVVAQEKIKEINHKERIVAVTSKLKNTPDTVAVFAKGLCCPSCAIGIRKKVSKLPFVDKSRFKKGVELDPYTQLASIAIKQGYKPDIAAISKAVDDAGYAPVHFFQMNGKNLQTVSLK